MKKTAIAAEDTHAEPPPSWQRALRAARRRPAAPRAPPSAPAAPTGSTPASSRAGPRAAGLEPQSTTTRDAAPLRRRAARASGARADDRRAQARRRCARCSGRCASTARSTRTSPSSSPRRSAAAYLPRVLRPDELAALLDRIPASTALELRDRALLELAYASGLRAEELVNLDVELAVVRRRGGARRGQGRKDADRARRRAGAARDHALPRARPPRAGAASRASRRCSSRSPGAAFRRRTSAAASACGRAPPRSGRRLAARAAALVRDAPARRRRGPARDPGAARAQLDLDDADLHARRVGAAASAPIAPATRGRDRAAPPPSA